MIAEYVELALGKRRVYTTYPSSFPWLFFVIMSLDRQRDANICEWRKDVEKNAMAD